MMSLETLAVAVPLLLLMIIFAFGMVIAVKQRNELDKENSKQRGQIWDLKDEVEWRSKTIQELQAKFESEVCHRQRLERELEQARAMPELDDEDDSVTATERMLEESDFALEFDDVPADEEDASKVVLVEDDSVVGPIDGEWDSHPISKLRDFDRKEDDLPEDWK